VRFQPASDRSLILYVADAISLSAHRRIADLVHSLEAAKPQGILNLHPAYTSLLTVFDPLLLTHAAVEEIVRKHLEAPAREHAEGGLVEIPVQYGGDAGPDLEELAAARGMTAAQAIDLHCSATYTAYFIGFVPGYAYLGGLPATLSTPRRATPRKRVPAGTVAIGGDQTGIYPFQTPGGWNLIGRTPLEIFRAGRPRPSLISMGDRVRFTPLRDA
jgi:KipI family sensor histidine kinase inhibitor